MRIAAFGFRSLPPANGSAGADKFAQELLPRLVARGHKVIAYNRHYPDSKVKEITKYKGVDIKTFSTIWMMGFDTLIHSFKCTVDIIFNNTADIVHIQNGGNSIWAFPLRIFGKKVFVSQDGADWRRDKWPWYAKLYLQFSAFLSSILPNEVIFDNLIAKAHFERKFNKKFAFIPFGSEIDPVTVNREILSDLNLNAGEYYLFVGRFIPDKGIHYLIPAFKNSKTNRKLVLVGGSPNPSSYEKELVDMSDGRIIFPGYVYGDTVNRLITDAYCYIQPSDVEGLSPMILTVMGLGIPMIVSDIAENEFAVGDTVRKFKKGDTDSLINEINYCEDHYPAMLDLASMAQQRALAVFNWDKVTEQHIEVFSH